MLSRRFAGTQHLLVGIIYKLLIPFIFLTQIPKVALMRR